MIGKLIDALNDRKSRHQAAVYGGMGLLVAGQKVLGLTVFASGFAGLERHYRERNEFTGTGEERWRLAVAFYEATHQHPVNRALHIVGIPMILGGTAGLIAFRPFRPLWTISAGWFITGWTLNFIGHGVFEKKAPAFADDPLSFVAGPVWDLQAVQRLFTGKAHAAPAAPAPPPAFKAAATAEPDLAHAR